MAVGMARRAISLSMYMRICCCRRLCRRKVGGRGGQRVGVQPLGRRHQGWKHWGSRSGGRGRDWLHGDDGVPALLPTEVAEEQVAADDGKGKGPLLVGAALHMLDGWCIGADSRWWWQPGRQGSLPALLQTSYSASALAFIVPCAALVTKRN